MFENSPYPYASGQDRLYLNNGAGTFTDATALRMPFDNDGTSAVASGTPSGNRTALPEQRHTIPLPPWGTLGIDPNYAILLPAFVIPPAAGVGSVTITVPNVPSLAGVSVYGQALLIQYPTQDRFTNVTADVVWN